MADRVSARCRSAIMRSVNSRDTSAEVVVRRVAHKIGLRFRLHDQKLPGKPDLVFSRWHKVIFVNGCFWHGHGCHKGRLPKSNLLYWRSKIATNQVRDRAVKRKLRALGWSVLTVWQCELAAPTRVQRRIKRFFERRT